MDSKLIELAAEVPLNQEALFRAAFPGVRELIAGDAYLSDTDENIFRRFMTEVVEPTVAKADETVKNSLRACLAPRTAATITAISAGVNFFGNLMPNYPSGLAPAVAALIVLAAHELRSRGAI